MSNVIITGSDGGLAKFLIREILDQTNRQLIGISRRTKGLRNDETSNSNIIYHYGDLRNDTFVRDVFSHYENCTVIHCAAEWSGFNRNSDILKNNLESTLNVVNNLRTDTTRIILISSSGVYDERQRLESSQLPVATSSYGLSKKISENLIVEYALYHGCSYTIWRPFHILSPCESPGANGTHVCTDLATRIIDNEEHFEFKEDNWNRCIPLTWVGDVANCIVENLDSEHAKHQIFNIASNNLVSVNQIAIVLIRVAVKYGLCSDSAQAALYEQDQFDKDYVTTDWFDKAFETLGWVARTEFSEMIEKFILYKYRVN